MNNLTKLQEVYFDICDLLTQPEILDIQLDGFQEFETLQEFLQEQKRKLEEVEAELVLILSTKQY